MLRISNIKMPVNHDMAMIKKKVCNLLRLDESSIKKLKISKKSVDARNKSNIKIIYSVDISVAREDKYSKIKDVSKVVEDIYTVKKVNMEGKLRPVIVGSGPAGLFAALILAEANANPIILERGKDVVNRKKDMNKFFDEGILDENSNVQFGEGGAGTYSDGKLTTGTKDSRMSKVIKEFLEAGAPKEILYEAKPHIGTDRLINVLINMRKKIVELGGEFRFSNKLVDIVSEDNKLKEIKVLNESNEIYNIETDKLILALGHSARDTFYMLFEKKMNIIPKAFSIGVRIEHKQEDINKSQYGSFYDKIDSADYKLNTRTKSGRGVYTFCMCPGGLVVGATSEMGRVVTNGMSCFKRDKENANSALLVSISPEDFPTNHPLSGIEFQRSIEKKAFELGGSNYKAPVQLVGDFLNDRKSTSIGTVTPSYKPGYTLCDMRDCFDDFVIVALKEAILDMDKKLKGFASKDAVMTAVESRSSAPIRILRDEKFQSNILGIYPCGEGSGYAGGIMSSSVDGIKIAEYICNII